MATSSAEGQPPAKRHKTEDLQGNQPLAPVHGLIGGQVQGLQAAAAQDGHAQEISNVQELGALKPVIQQARQNVLRIQRGGQRALELIAFHEQAPGLRDQMGKTVRASLQARQDLKRDWGLLKPAFEAITAAQAADPESLQARQVKAGKAVEAAMQTAEALQAALGTCGALDAALTAPGNESSADVCNDHGRVLGAVCAEFRDSTGLSCELQSHAGNLPDPADAGKAGEVRLVLPGVCTASVRLLRQGSALPIRLAVYGCDEACASAGYGSSWEESEHLIFRRISGLGMQALAHLQHPSMSLESKPPDPFAHLRPKPASGAPSHALAPSQPMASAPGLEFPHHIDAPRRSLGTLPSFPGDPFASPKYAASANSIPAADPFDTLMSEGTAPDMPSAAVLQDLLYWLASYVDLWSRPCSVTGRLLAADYGSCQLVAAYVRPFWLPSKELRAAALDAAQRKAFHSHAVPPQCFAARGL
ncbi:hypothetical protein WJX74_004884 [Apatococcus lobatus]|uniref:Uncharacterized protein n=1 Tax=Apatococcus lobatus TaxID=904363 RepID=A0AAW1RC62_9CHLO